jgi:hypothetical protein
MPKLAIIHFNPIEQYPPVLNWLNFLADSEVPGLEVLVFTMRPAGRRPLFIPRAGNIRIIRPAAQRGGKPAAYARYLWYYIVTTLRLTGWRPDSVLYYETLSGLPAIIYKRYIRKRSALCIHYHEYTSETEYREGMVLSRWIHRYEKKAYRLARWISQTNEDRAALFRKDMAGDDCLPVRVLPNYPPAVWETARKKEPGMASPIRIVYVGALSMETMFTREMADWVACRPGEVIWDIYSDNITQEAREFLESFGGKGIRFCEAVDYFSLPEVLAGYDVGIILYKGHIPNYVYNAPNKLFEYLACGLDVWFPDVMLGCLPYIRQDAWPKVLAVEFCRLTGWDHARAIDRRGLPRLSSGYYAEKIYPVLLDTIKNE